MRAIRIHQPGGPEVMRLEEAELAPPGKGEVRLRQHAIGINFIDIYHRTGFYPPAKVPYTPGSEGAGEVVEVGPSVEGFKPGDRVAYCGSVGAYAERAKHRSQVPVQAAARDLLRNRRGDDAQGPHGAISAAPDLSGERGRHDPRPRRRRRRGAHPLPMGQGARRNGDRPVSARRKRPRSPRKRARNIRSSTATRTSPSGWTRSPKARNAMWSTTASARRPSRRRSTA